MKVNHLAISSFCASLSFIWLCLAFEPAIPVNDKTSIGTEEDPSARYNYELSRLMDPATGEIPPGMREKELEFAMALPKEISYFNNRMSTFWTHRGPFNVGGKTRALAIDVSDEDVLLAGTTSGVIWRSSNGGISWSPTVTSNSAAPTRLTNVTCIAQDRRPGKTSIWYAGSGEANTAINKAFFLGNGLYKSTDGGLTWNALPSTATASNMGSIATNFALTWNIVTDSSEASADEVYAATFGAIYRSTNGGSSWTAVRGSGTPSGSSSFYTDVAITSTGIVYATLSSESGHRGIWRSTDGITWTNITPVTFPSTYKRIVIGIAPSDENQVYFLAETPGSGHSTTTFTNTVEWMSLWKYTYLSGSGQGSGGSWEDRSSNLPSTGTPTDRFFTQGSYDMLVKVKPDNPDVVFLGGTNLYRSNDGFATSTQITRIGGYGLGAGPPTFYEYPNHHPDQHALVFLPSDPDKMLSGCDGGVYRTDDNMSSNLSWTPLNNGYVTTQFYTIAMDHGTPGDSTVIGGAQDNGTWFVNSNNSAADWVHPHGGDGSFCAIADGKGTYYFSIQNSKIAKATVDNNGTKTAFRRIDPIGGKGYLFINPFTLDPNNNNIMYLAGGNAIWRNNDLSQIPLTNQHDSISTNWVKFTDTLTVKVSALTACKTPANRVYAGTDKQMIFRIDNANTGSNPVKTDITSRKPLALFPAAGNVSCIAADPTNGDRAIAVFSNYNVESLFFTSDGGANWVRIGGNLEGVNAPSCQWAAILPLGTDTAYFVGTTAGLYATSRIRGTSTVWVQQAVSTIGYSGVAMIASRPSDGLVLVATHGNGIFSARITDINQVVGTEKITSSSGIYLNSFPNPFAGETSIELGIARKERVVLKLYDLKGIEVDHITDQELEAGRHIISYSRKGLKPGVYLLSVNTGGIRKTRKLVLLEN